MTFPFRRKPLAQIICFGFAGFLASTTAMEALAQSSVPLRVDPVLLGLPPIKPGEAPAPARPAPPRPVVDEKARSEIKPVEAAVVESRPVNTAPEAARAGASGPAEKSSPALAAPVAPVVNTPSAVSVARDKPAPTPAALPAQQPARAVEPVTQKPAPTPIPRPVAPAYPVPAAASNASNTSSLVPLRVDPALLGLPPEAASASSVPFAGSSGKTGTLATGRSSSGATPVGKGPAAAKAVDDGRPWYQRAWAPVANAYDKGSLEFYLPLMTYHMRSFYTAEKIATYQERPKGFGVGRGMYNDKGDWEGVYGFAFQDSHFKPMYMAGYGWKSMWRPSEDTRLGLGYVAGLMARTDIMGYKPFPLALPLASVSYKSFSLEGTYVPGGKGFGNIFFIWAKWELGKEGESIGTPAKPEPVQDSEPANTNFGPSVPLLSQRVPYGPALEVGEAAGTGRAGGVGYAGGVGGTGVGQRPSAAEAMTPPRVAPTGWRDEEEVPDVSPALALRSAKSMVQPPKDSPVPRPVFLSAYRMGGDANREFTAEGDAELRKIGTVVNSDQLTYWPVDDEVEAVGNVRLEQGQDVISGPKMRLKMEDQVGYFEQPTYLLKRQPKPGSKGAIEKENAERYQQTAGGSDWNSGFAMPLLVDPTTINSSRTARTNADGRGEADRIDFEGENQIRMTNGTFTTCSPGNNDWYAKAGDIKLDYDNEVGTAKAGTVYFKDVPILYSPWLSFSLNNARKSGFLAPSFGVTSDSGFSLRVPYYWNIAPNRDATIATRLLSKRGTMLSSEMRYLDTAFGGTYRGEARVEVLPSDKARNGDTRYGMSLVHTQTTSNGFTGMINYNKVSDDNYFTDLTSNVVSTSQTQLMQQGMIGYGGGGWWNATANFQNYQTLQPDPKNPVLEQYRMLPQITVNARKPDLYQTDSSFMGQYTAFSKPKQVINGAAVADPDGQRLVLYPQVALPYTTPGWYVTPKVGLNMRQYALSGLTAGQTSSLSTTVPIVSVDTGMNFERSSNWFGRDYTQTLEPRLYYLNVPYRNQEKIPIFDTALADFNFAQIFSENQYSGWDRISNANQLTAAATTRLLAPSTGTEIVRAMLGQRFYFSKNQVSLPTTSVTPVTEERKWDKSDFLAAFSGQVLPRVYTDLAAQYNFSDHQFKRYSMGARYVPEPGKVLNVAYRYNRDETAPIDQVDFSAQWPITGRWYGVGRLNYSFKDSSTTVSTNSQNGRVIQSIAGLEYNGGCWVVRSVVQRLALTQDSVSSGFFLQLELNDFASIGSNPISILRRNIQGYSLINQPVAEPVFGQ
jgi:LPS-assembly protein